MFKACVLFALIALVGYQAKAQEAANGEAASGEAAGAPEPYSYSYETESHGAAEQRDASGKVTGYYTINDADGRQRRVEYFADESGFHAKVQTNEVGTKSENSADVEVQASPPTEGQLAGYYKQEYSVSQQQAGAFASPPSTTSVTTSTVQQPSRSSSSYYSYQQQSPQQFVGYGPAGYGYQTVSGYAPAGYGYSGYGQGGYGSGVYKAQYSSYGAPAQYVGYTGYNVPASQYNYKVTTTSNTAQPAQYSAGFGNVGAGGVTSSRYVSSSVQPSSSSSSSSSYRSSGYQSSSGPGAVSYSTGVVPAGPNPNVVGSSNFLVLKKRSSQDN